MRSFSAAILGAILLCGCAEVVSIDIGDIGGIATPAAAASAPHLDVVVRVEGPPDPLPLSGGHAVYTDVPGALRREIAAAAEPWVRAHLADRPGGFGLVLELTQAEARRKAGRLTVSLTVRATVSVRVGPVYL